MNPLKPLAPVPAAVPVEERTQRHCDYTNCSLPHGHIQSCNELDTKVPEEGTAEMEQPAKWECFSDSAYYDMWCVRRVGEKRFGFGYHVSSEAEARALCDELADHIEGKAK